MRRAIGAVMLVAACAVARAAAPEPPDTRAVADHVLAATVGISATTADGASFSGTGSVEEITARAFNALAD